MLIKAFGEVRKQIKNVSLLIIGDGTLKSQLKNLLKKTEMNNSILLLGERHDIPDLMKIFDIFTLSSNSEAASLVLLEAMASGIAVVATDAGGNSELVVDGETGILTPRGNWQEFSKNLVCILKNPAKSKKMGEAGRRRVCEKFSFGNMIDSYVNIYHSVLNK